MAIYKYHYIELDTKRSPRISLQNIVAGETGNRIWITVTNNGDVIDMSEKEDDEFIYRVSLRIDSDLGTRRQDSDDPDGGITFIEANTGDHGKINILLSADSFTAGKNRCRLEIYSKRSEDDDTLICSAEWTFDAAGNPTGENTGNVYPLMAYWEKLCESYAHGGTGKRDGEDIDNAEYYKDLSAYYKDIALAAIDQGVVSPSVEDWLDDNAERLALLKEYVTPEMYGAYGDGTHDDTAAVQQAINSGKICIGFGKTYNIANVRIYNDCDVRDCVFYTESIANTGAMSKYTLLVDAANLTMRFEDCVFKSTNDQNTSNNYVSGYTSNVTPFISPYGAKSLEFIGCKFFNSYYAVYVKTRSLTRFRCESCEFIGYVMGIDIAYCTDAIISDTRLTQNTSSTRQAHDIYIAEGVGNNVIIKGCDINSAGCAIHCNHGSSYDVKVFDTRIISAGDRPIVATGDSDTGKNKIHADNCTIECTHMVCDGAYNTEYTFNGCKIKCSASGECVYSVGRTPYYGYAVFNNCTIQGYRLANKPSSFINCFVDLAAETKRIIETDGIIISGCYVNYDCSMSDPIKTSGDCSLFNNVLKNNTLTNRTIYATNTGNVIKGNVFINCPQTFYPSDLDMTDNIFV